jgi:O-acetylhomoserine (thiol)-lyase
MSKKGFTTQILHSDRLGGVKHGSVHKPVHNSVAYGYETGEELAAVFQQKQQGYSYGRQNNPTTTALEGKITAMEQGLGTACFATGMAAITATLLTLLREGDHLISSQFLFGNTNSLFNTLTNFGIEVSFVDATEVSNVIAAKKDNTKAVFVETIANPCTQVSDMAAIGDFCEAEKLLYLVDNTMTSPVLFLPKDVKAGLVINALTKAIAGHANVLGGAVTDTGLFDWSGYSNILDTYKKGDASGWGLLQIRKKGLRDMGATLPPQSSSAIALGAETIALRVPRACDNARALAQMFARHPAVSQVHYPGLENHPQHRRAKQLFKDYGMLLSIDLKDENQCFPFLNRLRCGILSSHLGDNRTLVIPVAHTIFYEMGPERRKSMGISEGTVRISVGIEDQQDLLDDFSQALG